jgi:hypothetical protein
VKSVLKHMVGGLFVRHLIADRCEMHLAFRRIIQLYINPNPICNSVLC